MIYVITEWSGNDVYNTYVFDSLDALEAYRVTKGPRWLRDKTIEAWEPNSDKCVTRDFKLGDTTHNVPPVFSWFAGGAPEPRERLPLSSPPGARRFPFRIG